MKIKKSLAKDKTQSQSPQLAVFILTDSGKDVK